MARYDGHTVMSYNARDDRFSKRFVSIFGTATGQIFSMALDGSIYAIKNNELQYVPDNKLRTSVYPFIYFRGGLCDTAQLSRIGYQGDLRPDLWTNVNRVLPVDRHTLLACGKDQLLLFDHNKLVKTIAFPEVDAYRMVKQGMDIYFINNGLQGYRLDLVQDTLLPLGREGRLPVMPGGENVEQVFYAPYYDYLSGQINCWVKDTFYQLHIVKDKIGVEAAYHVPGMPDDAVVGFIHKKKQVRLSSGRRVKGSTSSRFSSSGRS